MKLIKQSVEVMDWGALSACAIMKKLEEAGRTCYQSHDRSREGSEETFCRMILKNGHHSVLEHHSITVKFITNRGVTHELVRHRLCAFSQESTRYCNYGGKDIEFIEPVWFGKTTDAADIVFRQTLYAAEIHYEGLLGLGWSPQQAREVLPNALKSEIVVTANIREWRHILNLRCSKAAHPQMRDLMLRILGIFYAKLPILFEDMWAEYGASDELG